MSPDESWALEPGDLIDSYVVERKLGEGGMGAVFKARHKETKYPVAIKILVGSAATNPQIIARFRREASAANEIGHPGFVRAIHLGSFRDRLYMIMELLEGRTLADEAKLSPMSVPRAVRILMQIGDALQAAHERGVVHRDLKPDNVFLLPGDVVRILDLGIAKFLNDTAEGNKTHSNAILGTPHTMSPEVPGAVPRLAHRSSKRHLRVRRRRVPHLGGTVADRGSVHR
jgi:serine/threonine-protein kinase